MINIVMYYPDGRQIYVRCGGVIDTSYQGSGSRIRGYHMDITEAKEAANQAKIAKSAFLSNMSHDIRTPMNAIMGCIELLEKEQSEDKKHEYMEKIKSSGHFLITLINNVLETAEIESGMAVLDEEPCNMQTVLDELYDVFSETCKEKGVAFNVKVNLEPQMVYCDAGKLKEIFLNLLSNACKFTSAKGTINVEVKQLPCDKEGYVTVQAAISDTGIGMSEEFLENLYLMFEREHKSMGNKLEGTGLGMTIVKHLVDLMGGTIQVESKLGKGTTFVVTTQHRLADEATGSRRDKAADAKQLAGNDVVIQGTLTV